MQHEHWLYLETHLPGGVAATAVEHICAANLHVLPLAQLAWHAQRVSGTPCELD
jgi:hypothetical protein